MKRHICTGVFLLLFTTYLFDSCKEFKIDLPVLSTAEITNITCSQVVSGGTITGEGGESLIKKGVCWDTLVNPTIENNKTIDSTSSLSFTCTITQIEPNIKYYVRAYATTQVGTGYGNEVTFTIILNQPGPQVNDSDGNVYNSVKIGNQIWMNENLKTTKFTDGTYVPIVTDATEWINLLGSAYCWFNNDEASYKAAFGALYNFYAINSGKLCPNGWHVSDDADWTILEDFLGGSEVAAIKLKSITGWGNGPGFAFGNNISGFSALPTGLRDDNGNFDIYLMILDEIVGKFGTWWSTINSGATGGSAHIIYSDVPFVRVIYSNKIGSAVRCVKDY